MKISKTRLEGVLVIEPTVFHDNRGFFMETYHGRRYHEAGISTEFVQDNLSCSREGVLRGLHYQVRYPQAKLVQVLHGKVFDVAVDLRRHSAMFGKWFGIELSAENKKQVFIPAGFAHGFCVLSPMALFGYKCSDYYRGDDEWGLLWNDSAVGIQWPVDDPIVSEKDRAFTELSSVSPDKLPVV